MTGSQRERNGSISIHAPTRGATSTTADSDRATENFNPRSHEGSDDCNQDHRSRQTDFNPRSHEGSDKVENTETSQVYISIHAPTRGATSWQIVGRHQSKKFQSTLPRGERLSVSLSILAPFLFQSTLPRGERPGKGKPGNRTPVFQSTLPRGERQLFSSSLDSC